jgi:hypothetical protein
LAAYLHRTLNSFAIVSQARMAIVGHSCVRGCIRDSHANGRARFGTAPMPKDPLRPTDDQLAAVLRAAEPLAVGDRGACRTSPRPCKAASSAMERAVAQVQRRYWDPPVLAPGPWWGGGGTNLDRVDFDRRTRRTIRARLAHCPAPTRDGDA